MLTTVVRRAALTPVIAAVATLAAASLAAAQPGAGAKYGTRDPETCTQGYGPRGTPTPAQVTHLVRCGQWESVSTASGHAR